MTTERSDARSAPAHTIDSVPTPRSGVRTGFGVATGLRSSEAVVLPAEEPERRSRAVTIAAALLAVVAVVAAVVAFRIIVPTTPVAEARSSAVEQATGEIREQPGSIVDFGQEYTYGDGLEVAINLPQGYEPSSNATGVESGVPTKVQVVLTNRTTEPFRPNTLQVYATAAGQEAPAVWDPDQGVGLTGPDVSVPAGSTIQFNMAFAPVDPLDLRLEITPALYGYGPMIVQRP
ncbi:hypothetical protein [Cellulomonas sp. S1-8]|uniref:hypothetical protein n=1 Tax=Cellulomonas sp. S1-8 TaxID=2904790 RepID=UPI002244A9D4|nr:hypothetical protein [Cellulomonas sp. S1-8]UZN03546.1 hypothetical protein OKX07_00955 [Cellulomonas sp. S1-8]